MMITVHWDNAEETIVRLDYADLIQGWEEYRAAVRQSYDLVRSKTHTVHLIHVTGSTKMPRGNALVHIRHAVTTAPTNTGFTFGIVSDMFAKSILELVMRLIAGHKFRFARSLQEAYAAIAAEQRELQPKPQ
jgi:hypothetical protein